MELNSQFTKEQLIKRLDEQMSSSRYALNRVQDAEIKRDIEMDFRLAEIALASLEAEPVYQYQSGIYSKDNGETDWYWDDCDAGFYAQYSADRHRILYAAPPAPDSRQVDELTMWVKRLAHSLRNAKPDSKLHSDAMDYLSRNGLISVEDVLR